MWIPGAPRLASLVQVASSKFSEQSVSKIKVKSDRGKKSYAGLWLPPPSPPKVNTCNYIFREEIMF